MDITQRQGVIGLMVIHARTCTQIPPVQQRQKAGSAQYLSARGRLNQWSTSSTGPPLHWGPGAPFCSPGAMSTSNDCSYSKWTLTEGVRFPSGYTPRARRTVPTQDTSTAHSRRH